MRDPLAVLFRVAAGVYAIPCLKISEVVPLVALHPIPQAPPWLVGALAHRGSLIPVADMCQLLGGYACPVRLSSRVVLASCLLADGTSKNLGLLAERMSEARRLKASRVGSAPLSAVPYLSEVLLEGDTLIQMLDVDQLLTSSGSSLPTTSNAFKRGGSRPVKRIETLLNREIGLCAQSIGSRAIEASTHERMLACRSRSIDEYVQLLERDPAERRALIEQIVVSETWFFRDDDVFRVLTEYVGNTWRKAHPESVLRVLSIPCATGEEAYSTSITLLEAGLPPPKYAIQAVDVSDRVVEFAKRGTYGKNSFRGATSPQRQAYFRGDAEGRAVAEEACTSVKFQRGNVLDPFLAGAGSFSVIFCRNLLIYLDRAARTRALDNIYNWLLPDGIVFAGHAEGLDTMDPRFQRGAECGSFGFVKRDSLRAELAGKKPPHALTSKTQKPALLVQPRVAVSVPKPVAPMLAPVTVSLAEAQQLADQGNLSLAAVACERLIQEAGPSAEAYCLMGIVRTALGEAERALQCFNKAVYLAPKHYTALANLALAHERRGERIAAQNFRRRAEDALGKGPTP